MPILFSVDDQIKEDEQKREHRLHDISKILIAEKSVMREAEEIEQKAIEVKGLVVAFKEFTTPKLIIKPQRENQKRLHKALSDSKKKHSPIR